MSAAKPFLKLPAISVVVLLLLALFLRGTSYGREKSQVRLLFTGDILLSRGVESRLVHCPQALSRALHPMLAGFDWTAGNLEGAIGPPGSCRKSPPNLCFSVPSRFVPFLSRAGFKAIGLENNHSSDLGPGGLKTTRRLICQNGMAALTYEDSPRFVNFGNFTVAFITLSMIPGWHKRAVPVPGMELRQKLRLAKNLSNLVIVSVHWGSELIDWPDKRQCKAADWLVKHGAGIIIGAHPHVVQEPECIDGRPVFYSLGNLVFDQKYASTKEGLLAECQIRGKTVSCTGIRTVSAPSSVLPVEKGVDGEAEKALNGCGFKLTAPLKLNGITLRAQSRPEQGRRRAGLLIEGERDGKVLWKKCTTKIVSIEPMKVESPERAEYLFTLERHFSHMDNADGLRPCVYEVRPEGLIPKWKGTALAWPLRDAAVLPGAKGVLCAQHRGDSFIELDPDTTKRRFAAYRWDGFGFSGIHDRAVIDRCRQYLK